MASMKTLTCLIILFFYVFMYSTDAEAQKVKEITGIDEAISLALENNSALKEAKYDKLKADEKVSEVYSENLIPNLTLNSRYSRTFQKQVFDIFGEKYEVGSDNSITNTLDMTLALPVLGTPVMNGIRIAEFYSKYQSENILSVKADIKNNVKKAYYGVLLARAVVEVNKMTLENTKANYDVVNARYRSGVATEFDFLRAKVKMDNVKPLLSQSERNLEISKKMLSNAIGFKDVESIEVKGELEYDSTEVWEDINTMIKKISEQNVAVRQMKLNREINKELVSVDKSDYLPKLYVFGQYALSSNENDSRSVSSYRFFNTSYAGLGLTWELNLFRKQYKVNQSELELKKNDEQIVDLMQKLKLLSESAIIALNDAKERIISQKMTVELAERGLELANASYRAGTLNQIDVQDSELSLYNSRLSFYQAVYDYQVAKAELEKLLEK
ncbi:MAG: Outer membrane protein TolC [Ignavibacteria bacterium]|nr:Outer membrane protein TolC [Ignavibacteria bacterium]